MVKYGEIGVKGKNKYVFEDALLKQMRIALNHVEGEFKLSKEAGRVYVEMSGNYDYNAAVDTLSRVFGIVAICPMLKVENKDFDNLKAVVVEYVKDIYKDKIADEVKNHRLHQTTKQPKFMRPNDYDKSFKSVP